LGNRNFILYEKILDNKSILETDKLSKKEFQIVEKTKPELGIRAKGRKVVEIGLTYQLREPQVSYPTNLDLENDDIGAENTRICDVY
jgi:hypothetical protein